MRRILWFRRDLRVEDNLLLSYEGKVLPIFIFDTNILKTLEKERFVGKTCILGLGFSMSGNKLYSTLELNPLVDMNINECNATVDIYRTTYPAIPRLWKTMQRAISCMISGTRMDIGPVYTEREAIVLPNGMKLRYPGLMCDVNGDYFYNSPNGQTKIYGGKLTENVVQALARIVLSIAELRLAKRGLYSVMQVHDELIYVVRAEHVHKYIKAVELALNAKVSWMPNLPVASEVAYGLTYYDAK